MTTLHLRTLVAVSALTFTFSLAHAQAPPPPEQKTPEEKKEEEKKRVKEEITVTGTRVEGRTATETPAPVDVVDETAIRSTGAVETGKVLQLLEPSFNFSTTFISDGTDIIRPATLRGLGPDQTLVLVNGKRRHQQALVNFQQTIGRGSTGYDINTIPTSAIERIEVLRDGAAAQYGSDAIAGVINIILKGNTKATDVTLDAGQYYKSDGQSVMGGVNTGWGFGTNGFLNLTAEYRHRDETNRAGPDSLRVNPPRVTQRIGDPIAKDASLWLNAGLPAGPGELYAFGSWSDRKGNSSGFFRSKGDGRTVPAFYPNGFLPTIVTHPTDTSLAGGYRGNLTNAWKYDASANWGKSRFKFREENTVNVSYFYEPKDPNNPNGPRFNESPNAADTGTLQSDQLAFNLDFTGKVKWGVGAGPLDLAFGAERRREGYKITPGEPVSYQYGRTNNRNIKIFNQNGGISAPGTQGFPGYAQAVNGSRNNTSVYGDAESQLTKRFLAGAAVRFEDYSDFGNTTNGKLSGRFDLSDHYSLRGTASTGFRAPSVAQIFHTLRSTNLNSAGVLTDTLSTNQDHPLTKAFGIPPLKKETSNNYSIGLVAKPSGNFRVTADLYHIKIKDRIVLSSYIDPSYSETVKKLLDPDQIGQIQFFTNILGTRTNGLDLVALYDWTISTKSLLGLEAAANFNKTKVTGLTSPTPIVSAAALFGPEQVTLLEEGQPRQHYVLSGTHYYGPLKTNLRFNYFGKVAGSGFTYPFKQEWSGKWITDLAFTYALRNNVDFTVGGLNIFNVYPDKWDPVKAFPFPQLGFVYGWETVPFGINGGYYYARINYRFAP